MDACEVLAGAFAMPRTSPSYPVGPYRYVAREFLTITYATDPTAIAVLLPEPPAATEAQARLQCLHMPDSAGFGDRTKSGQAIPVCLGAQHGGYACAMSLDDDPPIVGGRELMGLPNKLARPTLRAQRDTLLGALDDGGVRLATGSMSYKHRTLPDNALRAARAEPGFLLKIIPHVDGPPRICVRVRDHPIDVVLKGAWRGPAALALAPHALAPVADLPVLEVASATRLIAELTLGLGEVVHDHLAPT